MYENVSVDSTERLNQIGYNNKGELMEIVIYNSYDDIIVRFLDSNKCEVHTQYINFLKGNVKNYMRPTHGYHGFIGQGKYQSEYTVNGDKMYFTAYTIWSGMHRRSNNFDNKHPTYTDVNVCEEWWNFQNFAKWYEENIYYIDDEVMCIDKDIKYPGNKEYSPDSCIIVPNRINDIFKNNDIKSKDNGLPVGVNIRRDGKNIKYRARCNVRVGYREYRTLSKTFDNIKDAYDFYKKTKENYIKDVANEYKNKLPKTIYNLLTSFRLPDYDNYCTGF